MERTKGFAIALTLSLLVTALCLFAGWMLVVLYMLEGAWKAVREVYGAWKAFTLLPWSEEL